MRSWCVILTLTIALALMGTKMLEAKKPVTKKIINPTATIKTNKGTVVMELYMDDAPIAAGNFVKLAKKKFFDGITFHRYVEGFVIQGGDPEGTGRGGPGYTIKDETNKIYKHIKGAVGMARSSDRSGQQIPNSAGSQFYICLSRDERIQNLDGGYTVFGQVTKGMDVVEKLRQGDKMISVSISEHKALPKGK